MQAAFVAVGSELLGTERLDTNSLRVATLLRRYGVPLRRKSVLGDVEADLEAELRHLLGRFELVVVSGGLGPTADDVTREAVAAACERRQRCDESVVDDIRAKFAAFGRAMPEVNRRQAWVLEGAALLDNPRGTAPGQRLEHGGTTLFLLPGVPRELDGMLERDLEPWLAARHDGEAGLGTAVLKVACLPESEVEERLAPAYRDLGREAISVLATPGEIRIELHAAGAEAARRERLAGMRRQVRELLAPAVFSEDAAATLEAVVGELLRRARTTVATGESCTGGLVAQRLTAVAGSSDVFRGGIVAYDDRVKEGLLEVPASTLVDHGAVSEPVARALAAGARRRVGSDYGIGITGIAGPGGGSPEKPVGTVHLALAGPGSDDSYHLRVVFPGDRATVRHQTSQLALEMLRRKLLGIPIGNPRQPGAPQPGAPQPEAAAEGA